MSEPIKVLKPYKKILEGGYTYYCYYGGRGGGKTDNIAHCLVLKSITTDNLRILCIREVELSVKESVYRAIVDSIEKFGIQHLFKINNFEIECLKTGSRFIFSGMSEAFVRKIKSIKRINITWIEEATDISQNTWLTLIPSVLREPNSSIVVSFNPKNSTDIVYNLFIGNTPPENTYLQKITYRDNPFFADSPLEQTRLHQQKVLPIELYNHIWEGDILKNNYQAIWTYNLIQSMYAEVDIRDLVEICIGTDPAVSNKDYSNEFGIVVLGKDSVGRIYALADKSGVLSISDFVKVCVETYYHYKDMNLEPTIIIETNQGGDFIKYSLLENDKNLHIKEVRAIKDKVGRALPVSNLCNNQKVFLDKGQDFTELVKQMQLMTYNGYNGAKGESPDRLDAFVWGVYHLSGLKSLETQGTIFSLADLADNKDFGFIETINNLICYIENGTAYYLIYDIVSNQESQRRVKIIDSFTSPAFELNDNIIRYSPDTIILPNNNTYIGLSLSVNYSVYDTKNEGVNFILENADKINSNVLLKDNMPIRTAINNDKGELIKIELLKFHRNIEKEECIFVLTLAYLINYLL